MKEVSADGKKRVAAAAPARACGNVGSQFPVTLIRTDLDKVTARVLCDSKPERSLPKSTKN